MPLLDPTRAALLAAALAALAGLPGCSFVVESQDRQCETDTDCVGFDDAVCDVSGGVCVPRGSASTGTGGNGPGSTGAGSTSTGCEGPDGCFACAPDAQVEFLNGCTDTACIPYDNGQLEGLLLEDGSVPPVP